MSMKSIFNFSPLLFALYYLTPSFGDVGGVSGSNIFSVSDGNATHTTWKIGSASTLGDPIYSGSVSSHNNSTKVITFLPSTDENNNTIYPFVSGSFNPNIQLPESNYTVEFDSDGNITSISDPTYGPDGFDTSGIGFSSAPEVIVSPSDGGGTTAELTASIGDGKISSFSIDNAGTDYSISPAITVVGGPHFVRILGEDSPDFGRCFLITSNTNDSLTLDMSNITQSEASDTVGDFFPDDTLIEVIRAPTLGSIFGSYWVDDNWTSAKSFLEMGPEDWVYVWDPSLGGYTSYSHIEGSGYDGWYSIDLGFGVKCNNTVIYPDEAFIIAKRNPGTVTIESEVSFDDSPARLYLPATDDAYIANNPFGMDLLLTEIIPSTSIGSGASKFRPSADGDNVTDSITLLSGSTWKRFYYKNINSSVTSSIKSGSKAGTGAGNGMTTNDLFIGSGTVTVVETCTNAAGAGATTNGNDGNFTKLTLSGTTPATGFTITLSDIQGYMLSDDGANELNATTLESVDTNGTGSIVYSNISGNFEIVGSGSGYVVIEKQRDVNFKSDEGSPAWSIGNVGAGYSNSSSTATWYAVGGGGTGANGTITTNGSGQYSSFNLTAGGSGYLSAPQIIISGGGWRYQDDNARDNEVVNASDGIIIYRGSSSGDKAFIEASNPTD